MAPPSRHILGLAKPCLPAALPVGSGRSELGPNGGGGGEQKRCKERGRVRWDTQSYKETMGHGGDTYYLNDPGQVTQQNLSFPICAMGLIPTWCQLHQLKHVKGLSESLAYGALSTCPSCSPSLLKDESEGPGPALVQGTCRLALLQVRGCKPMCAGGGPRCVWFSSTVFCRTDDVALALFSP